MNAFVVFPQHRHWNPQQLADAVPLRLHEMFAFDAGPRGAVADSANDRPQPKRAAARDYLPAAPALDVFRVR